MWNALSPSPIPPHPTLQVKKAREMRAKMDLVAFQLTKMHDRLPPLSIYNRKFKLDDWQVRLGGEMEWGGGVNRHGG
jgi:hypothetical protein